MKIFKSKKLFSMLAILLILSFVVSMFTLPNANAQSTREITTWPFADAIPHTAGVGQPVLINWGLLNYLNNVNDGWNVTLQITYPDGKVENITGKTWSTGTVGRKMSFSEPGNYTLRAVFDGETYRWGNNGVNGGIYKPSISENVTLQILTGFWKLDYPGHIHPTEYWTRPVDSQLREWYSIMGSWVEGSRTTNRVVPWNDGPETAHVLWSTPMGDTPGGLSGGATGPIGFQTGDAYEGKFENAVIIAGVLYNNRYVANSPRQTVVAIDLHTGKTLWEKDFNFGSSAANRISRGQILNFLSENNRGSWAYLWFVSGTTMHAVDPATGDLKFNMTSVPSGTIYIGPSGEMLKYAVTNIGTAANPDYRLTQWNSTHVVANSVSGGVSDAWGSQIQGRTFNAERGYDINVSIPGLTASPGSVVAAFPEDRVILSTTVNADGLFLTGISLDPENAGYTYFNRREFKAPAEWADFDFSGYASQNAWVTFSNDPYVGVFWTKDNRANYGFSLETGRFLWQTESRIYSDAWVSPKGLIAYGNFYSSGVGGIAYCYDALTGEQLWTYEATDKYNESYHGENWWLIILFVTDGKVYFGHMVHSNTVPISRGAPFIALDAETGDLVWEIDGAFRQSQWAGLAMIGDSIIVTPDVYDQQIYAVGKGPSEMTVSVSNPITTAGSTIMISGTVMDVSPGTEQDNLRLRFPNGVPAVGDKSQSEWMLYLYKQFEAPMSVTGIEITAYAWDVERNEKIDIGTVESDSRGTYSIKWTPDREGDYEIWTYFEGTAAFFGDDAKTTIAVLDAPLPPPEVETPPYEWYIIGGVIAIIAVLIVGILMILRKIDKNHNKHTTIFLFFKS
jgi:hypothetical protein